MCYMGVYAVEEHFTPGLIEKNGRKEGVIFKFNEDPLWAGRLNHGLQYVYAFAPFEASRIRTFGSTRVRASAKLTEEFEYGRCLLEKFRYENGSISEIFDIDQLAKFFALIDLTDAFHTLVWHNRRFYLNPESRKLEPIGYDGHPAYGPQDWRQVSPLGYFRAFAPQDSAVFENKELFDKYLAYLDKYCKKEFVSSFLKSIDGSLKKQLSYIRMEHPYYPYDENDLYHNAGKIDSILTTPVFEGWYLSRDWRYSDGKIVQQKVATRTQLNKDERILHPIDGLSVLCNSEPGEEGKQQILIRNYHPNPVKILGFGVDSMLTTNSKLMPAYEHGLPATYSTSTDTIHTFTYFKVLGNDTLYRARVSQRPYVICND